jgi:hypothetical protein
VHHFSIATCGTSCLCCEQLGLSYLGLIMQHPSRNIHKTPPAPPAPLPCALRSDDGLQDLQEVELSLQRQELTRRWERERNKRMRQARKAAEVRPRLLPCTCSDHGRWDWVRHALICGRRCAASSLKLGCPAHPPPAPAALCARPRSARSTLPRSWAATGSARTSPTGTWTTRWVAATRCSHRGADGAGDKACIAGQVQHQRLVPDGCVAHCPAVCMHRSCRWTT